MTILWLEDKLGTISYEMELIREENDNIIIETFELIDELLEYLESNEFSSKEVLFIIDVMLIDETKISFKDTDITIPEDLMAGVTLYTECLKKYFADIPVILYTSRGTDDAVFRNIHNDSRFKNTLFLIGKEELETGFKDTLLKLGVIL